jgi:hypothetical protein
VWQHAWGDGAHCPCAARHAAERVNGCFREIGTLFISLEKKFKKNGEEVRDAARSTQQITIFVFGLGHEFCSTQLQCCGF